MICSENSETPGENLGAGRAGGSQQSVIEPAEPYDLDRLFDDLGADGSLAPETFTRVPRPFNPDRVPRRVLALSWRDPLHPQAGGAEVMLHEHMRRWLAEGHEVTLFAAAVPGRPNEEVVDGVKTIRRGSRFTVYLWAALMYLFRLRKDADVVIDVENGIPFFSPLYVRKPLVCLIHHVHADQFLWEFGPIVGRLGRFIETKLMPHLYRHQKFVAVSESTRDELEVLGFDESQIRVVHNGLDHAAYAPASDKSQTPRLIYVGRLKRHKRVDMVIQLCARVREEIPDLELDIVGTGDDEGHLRELVVKENLQSMVHFHGFSSHLTKVELYSRSWAMVTATEREGWGLSVIEAAACGTPTLSFDVPGVRDAVVHGRSGYLASSRDDLYAAMRRVLTDRAWRLELSSGALARAKRFSWEVSARAARDAWVMVAQTVSGQPVRRESKNPFVKHVVFSLADTDERSWSEVSEALRHSLREHDRIVKVDGGVQIQAEVSRHSDIDGVTRRVYTTLEDIGYFSWRRDGFEHMGMSDGGILQGRADTSDGTRLHAL